ncbi:MAG TPA: tRNA (N6-isopentenyl adenosine(37)-C2)-methylthiotransferase MiaB [Thermoanaerobaculia bacterium]|jgi:tRNA-2-methylthio-N6-dimethylallyladenosine synthase|nr:tRNA (N6-isopentenyl adenosine(37)-C2)-methylthiotransferase MiaB [Thermoanaerobaculia bacterium]
MPKSFFIETWGCQMNDLDSQRLSGTLKLRGYTRVDDKSAADLILLNTCSVRDKAEQKMLSELGRLRELKREKNGELTIGVCGCVAQQEGERILERAPWVDFVMGPGNVGYLDEVLDFDSGRGRGVAVEFPEDRRYDYLTIDRDSTTKAYVTIIEGCNKNCTFCIVPTTRGREVSRPFDDVLAEVRAAVEGGRVEIELLGQTVNAYRCPITGRDFGALLSAVAEIEGVVRLRFTTSHPSEVNDSMIAAMRDHANISRYLHLPVQSGSSKILRRMKRLYTRERYLEVIARIREAIPEIHFSTDIIVGFPGETEEDFQQTLSMIEEVRYGSLFAFKYSPRPGTPALKIGDAVDDAVSSDRLTRLFDLHEQIKRERLESYRGRVVPVLYEGPSKHDPSVLAGRTDDNWVVNFAGETAAPVGSILGVRIASAKHHTLHGEVA